MSQYRKITKQQLDEGYLQMDGNLGQRADGKDSVSE